MFPKYPGVPIYYQSPGELFKQLIGCVEVMAIAGYLCGKTADGVVIIIPITPREDENE